jgi:hypothetical protein
MQEPVATYSDIVSDGGMDPRNKFDHSPERETEQKPVAIVEGVVPHLEVIIIKHILGARFPKIGDLLYTSPLRREWQYLTETEIDETLDNNLEGGTSLVDICRAIEVKIKEKNHS